MDRQRFSRPVWWLAVFAAPLIWGITPSWATDGDWTRAEEPVRFLRLLQQEDGEPKALQAAIVRCAPAAGADRERPTVDLISAVHMAEPEFYRQLNREFTGYDAVLYELVAPEGTRIPKDAGRKASNPFSRLQHGLTDLLELEFQLEGIDYTQHNLVHADMSPEQFDRSMKDRGESFGEILFRMMGYSIAQQHDGTGKTSDARLLVALFSGNRAMALRRVMAEQFQNMQGALNAMDGPEGSTLIAERNKVALEVLQKELTAGKQKVAIFYGAGHMDDIVARLRDDFGLVPVEIRWLTAWKLQ
ncbi:MAG: hypothetical protein RBS80_08895 [Thermoguttaceae bacterium]|jgi:hypothetical protein|nr:hypothetical protein [Thermoguttaceae bacterium]